MKKYLMVSILLFFTIILLNMVSAEEINQTDDNNIIVEDTYSNDIVTTTQDKTEVSNNDPLDQSDDGDDCCTSIIQGYNNDSALSFRRDSTAIVSLNVKHNTTHIKQTKASGTYFFHVIITKDGWLVGNGGTDGEKVSKNVEKLALSMIANKKITTSTFNQIYNLKSNSKMCHFVIKAPNGTYSLMTKYKNRVYKESGVLKAGQYVVVPNSPNYFHKGYYKNYTKLDSIVQASRMLNSLDKYGTYRHNIITYYYNPAAYSKVKITASNDDGKYVKRNDAKYVNDIITNTKTILSKNIPIIDSWVDVDEVYLTYNKMKTLITSENITTTNKTLNLKAYVNDQFGNPVNEGYVSFVLNNHDIINSLGQTIKVDVKQGVASFKYTPKIDTNAIYNYCAKYINNKKYIASTGNIASIVLNLLNETKQTQETIETTHDSEINYNTNITIKTKLLNTKTSAKIYYKINNNPIINSLGNTIYITANKDITFNVRLSKIYTAGNYTLTTVYSYENKTIERKTYFTIEE